jgi:hypothetical protein
LWGGLIFSFIDPANSPVSRLFAGTADRMSADDWACSDAEDERRRFVWLLKAALQEQSGPALRSSRELMWVAATAELPLEIPIPGTFNTRTLVKRYEKADGETRYVRHLGFEPRFVSFGDQWFLEITPTYHFTRDGREPDRFAAEHRSGIKRIERHQDFRRNVDSLALILRGDVDLGGLAPDTDHRFLEFGQLESVLLDSGGEHDVTEEDYGADSEDAM